MINTNAAIVLPVIEEIFPEGIVAWFLAEVSEGINVSQLNELTESLARLRLKQRILLPVVRTEAINVLRDDVKVSPYHNRYFLFVQGRESPFQPVHPGQLIHKSVRPNRIAIW